MIMVFQLRMMCYGERLENFAGHNKRTLTVQNE